nr:hypothetical protein [Tanacetum cinerariifolium]
MGVKFARELISRMKLLLNMMEEWTQNLNSARVEMQFFQVTYLHEGGNKRSYVLILESGPTADASHSIQYFSRISTKVGFCRVGILPLIFVLLGKSTT